MAITEPEINFTTEQYLTFAFNKYLGENNIPIPYDILKDIINRLSTNETNVSTNTTNISSNTASLTTKANNGDLVQGVSDGEEIGKLQTINYNTVERTLEFVFDEGSFTISVTTP